MLSCGFFKLVDRFPIRVDPETSTAMESCFRGLLRKSGDRLETTVRLGFQSISGGSGYLGGATSAEGRFQWKVVPSEETSLVLLFAPESGPCGPGMGGPARRRPSTIAASSSTAPIVMACLRS